MPAFPPKDARDNRREKTWKGPKSLRAAAKKKSPSGKTFGDSQNFLFLTALAVTVSNPALCRDHLSC